MIMAEHALLAVVYVRREMSESQADEIWPISGNTESESF